MTIIWNRIVLDITGWGAHSVLAGAARAPTSFGQFGSPREDPRLNRGVHSALSVPLPMIVATGEAAPDHKRLPDFVAPFAT
ncbi:hypothetical protein [Bradyrhizobium sp. LTSP849]|uniref:hypothetical protein n=1 Tax=Bradyrhizobium sp. LTSP849 TaxID=1615890 RepID=UPI0012E052E6|nr:hypothetical protein [Bradyrhizobium sp. LTSP849]